MTRVSTLSAAVAGLFSTIVWMMIASPAAAAEEFQTVTDESGFVELVQGKVLVLHRPFLLRNSIKLTVSPQGSIRGIARGDEVTGNWNWRDGYFCREMAWGGDTIPFNCQSVQVNGEQIRFIADQGKGMRADFRLD